MLSDALSVKVRPVRLCVDIEAFTLVSSSRLEHTDGVESWRHVFIFVTHNWFAPHSYTVFLRRSGWLRAFQKRFGAHVGSLDETQTLQQRRVASTTLCDTLETNGLGEPLGNYATDMYTVSSLFPSRDAEEAGEGVPLSPRRCARPIWRGGRARDGRGGGGGNDGRRRGRIRGRRSQRHGEWSVRLSASHTVCVGVCVCVGGCVRVCVCVCVYNVARVRPMTDPTRSQFVSEWLKT